jgi:hypothetical protein
VYVLKRILIAKSAYLYTSCVNNGDNKCKNYLSISTVNTVVLNN